MHVSRSRSRLFPDSRTRATITNTILFRFEFLDTYLGTVEQNDSRKIYRAKHALSRVEGTPRTQRKILCHFDRREKSFLDPSHPLGMTALGPLPWRPLRLCARHVFPISSSSEHFKYLWLAFIPQHCRRQDCQESKARPQCVVIRRI